MINKIQKRFIIIAMASVTIVLLVILGGINLANYKNVRSYADAILESLAEHGGTFAGFSDKSAPDDRYGSKLTNETPFETRYFTVCYDTEHDVSIINTASIASVDSAKALDYAETALSKSKTKGNVDEFRYLVTDTDMGTMVLFVDCSRQLATARAFLTYSVLFSVCAELAFLLLLAAMSRRFLSPIIDSYQKQKSFITDASHELKTPLTIISANNELIEMDYGESESTKAIAKQVVRLTNMTKNLTMLAKIDESDIMREKAQFNLSDTIADVVASYQAIAATKGKNIHLDAGDKIEFTGDENLIRQMLTLMLDNCIKYGKENVYINLSKAKKNIKLEVKNDVENIENGNLNKYFERFYRSDESRASGVEGSGIGLSIVREIVELHKGTISAEGKDGEFIITITL